MTKLIKPRVGFTNYLNCAPIYHGLVADSELFSLDFGHPRLIAERLECRELDLAQVSLYYYLKNCEHLELCPEFCIATAADEIRSVLLFSKKNITDLNNCTVSLTPESLTSVKLLQILCEGRFGVFPCWSESSQSEPKPEPVTDAYLLIGDSALSELHNRHSCIPDTCEYTYTYDLLSLWQEWTGLPFVFAVFVGRENHLSRNPEILSVFRENLQKNQQNPVSVIQHSSLHGVISEEQLLAYLGLLTYQITPEGQKAISLYQKLVSELG